MSRSYRNTIKELDNRLGYKIRRKQFRRRARHQLRNLLSNQYTDPNDAKTQEIIKNGWGLRMGWTETVDDKFVGKTRPFKDSWRYEYFITTKDSLKRWDREHGRDEDEHKKCDRYLKDKHRKHQGKAKKRK